MLESLLERYRRGDRRALARLLTLVSHGEQLEAIAAGIQHSQNRARIVAVTGSGGVGKSSLIGKLVEKARPAGQRVAVLACDPQSPLTGGALLADRLRMPAETDDDVFIRSLAAPSGHGAVAEHLDLMVRLFEGFGFQLILIETVGAGQGDVAVRELADVVVLLLQPEAGDDFQWEKAGVLEVADIVAIHKADLPQAEHVESHVRAMLALAEGSQPVVLRVSARSGAGLGELWDAVWAAALRPHPPRANHKAILDAVRRVLKGRLELTSGENECELTDLEARWREGKFGDEMLTREFIRILFKEPRPSA
jgi:LAO/AO transport system ATPase